METAPVSSDPHGLASIRCANVFDYASVYLAGFATHCASSHLRCNCELTERAGATDAGAVMNAKPMVARGVHNRALI